MSERTAKIIIVACLLCALIFGILAVHSYIIIRTYEHANRQIETIDDYR
jgi:hypothetical protein